MIEAVQSAFLTKYYGKNAKDAKQRQALLFGHAEVAFLRDAAEVLVAGSSAGAMGVQNNLDRIAARLSWAKVRGAADSGYGCLPRVSPRHHDLPARRVRHEQRRAGDGTAREDG